ncbi:MAG: DUF3313 family protein, partial [Nitrospiraceae bacterium]|nr:DUF3313 family protein [Nitrospiraceae bacterium]
RVMRGLRLLQRHGVEYNVLASVARDTAAHPLDVYRFLRGEGVGFIQFAPIVERMPDARSRRLGPRLAGPEGGVALVYIKQGADFSKYNEVMFDQVVFYLKKDAKYKNIQPEQMKQLADEFARAAAKAMQGAYPVVGEPGPDVLRVRVAITDIEPGNPVRSGMTTVLPIGLAVSIIQKGATGKYPGVGSASMEAEFLDSLTNERLAAAIDKRAGSKFSGFSKFASAKEAFDFWSKRLRIFLDKAHGRTR